MMKFTIAAFLFGASCLASTPGQAQNDTGTEQSLAPHSVEIVRDWVTTGSRSYQVLNDGVVDGRIDVSSHFVDGELAIHDHSASTGLGVDEDIFLRLDGETFTPKSVHQSADFSGTHVLSHIAFESGKATGELSMHRAVDGLYRSRAVAMSVPDGFFLRASAIYLVNAMKAIQPGGSLKLNWLNSVDGKLSEISLAVEGTEIVEVPAGRFDCLVVRLTGGQPDNLIYDLRKLLEYLGCGPPDD